MRRAPVKLAQLRLALAAALGAGATSCTLLAQFTDEPRGSDAGPDAAPIQGVDGGNANDARAEASGSNDPCLDRVSGSYCATDGLNDYTGPSNDLLQCDGGAVAKVTTCDAGCLSLEDPFPDTCNACDSKSDGSYCGRDFASFPGADADWLVTCQSSNAVQLVACAHGCLSNGAAASCAP